MMIIGALNEKEGVTKGTNRSLPKPMVKALKTMLDELKSPDQIDAVRVAALIGILRHAKLSRAGVTMHPAAQNLVTRQAVELLKSPCPSNRTKSAHEWMQRREMEILGALGSAGTNSEIVKSLDATIRDENASIAKRCSAIDAMSNLKIVSDPGIDIEKTTLGLGTITATTLRPWSSALIQRALGRANISLSV